MTCSRSEMVDALHATVITGRGEASHLIIGVRKFHALLRWLLKADGGALKHIVKSLKTGRRRALLGVSIVITTKYPDILFAATKSEYATVRRCLKVK